MISRLYDGDNVLPPYQLGACSFQNCQKAAVFRCWIPLTSKSTQAVRFGDMPVLACEQPFCEDHCLERTKGYQTGRRSRRRGRHGHGRDSRRLINYNIRSCDECNAKEYEQSRQIGRQGAKICLPICGVFIVLALIYVIIAVTMARQSYGETNSRRL